MRRLEPGEVCALSLVGAALAMDVVLIRKGHKPISEVVRGNAHSRRLVRALSAHLCDTVPFDVLTLAGARLAKRAVDAAVAP